MLLNRDQYYELHVGTSHTAGAPTYPASVFTRCSAPIRQCHTRVAAAPLPMQHRCVQCALSILHRPAHATKAPLLTTSTGPTCCGELHPSGSIPLKLWCDQWPSSTGHHTLQRVLSIGGAPIDGVHPPDLSALSMFFLHTLHHLLPSMSFGFRRPPGYSVLSWLAVRYSSGHPRILLAANVFMDTNIIAVN